MHSIHFAFAIGCFAAPVLAKPFLGRKPSLEEGTNDTSIHTFDVVINTTIDTEVAIDNNITSRMEVLYPIVGCFAMLTSIGYLVYGIKECSTSRKPTKKYSWTDTDNLNFKTTEKDNANKNDEFLKICLVLILLVFIFLYAGMEVQYGTFVATFAVKSDLNLTRQEGAKVNAIFWGSFAAMRFAAIFISFKMSALSQMILSFTLCAVGSIFLAIAGNIYKYGLCVCSALLGTGMASVYACGILWIEQHITVTNRIVSSMVISGSVGADLFPIILGQFMATFPMLLMYLQVSVVFMCIALFSTAYGITRIISKNKTT